MTMEETICALDIVEHMESFSVLYEPGETMNQTTVGKLKEACRLAVSILRARAGTPPNDPLTLEELREMDGEPVWVTPMRGSGGFGVWMLVDVEYELCRETHGEMAVFENCGKTWTAYRHKPEEGTR